MTDKMKNLVIRAVSGGVLVAVMIGAIVWSHKAMGELFLLLTAVGLHEFYALARKCGYHPLSNIGTVAGLCFFALLYWLPGLDSKVILCCLLALLLFVPLLFVCLLWRKSEHPIADIGVTLMGVFYLALPFGLLCLFDELDFFPQPQWSRAAFVLCYFFIIWANDVFAYLVGMAFGRHPLFPRHSPKKSWEGFFGGVLGALCVGGVIAYLSQGGIAWPLWLGLSLVISVTGVAGDLVESMFKRAAGVKDSSNLIPGHGGVLDRFDAVLLSAPFVFVYASIYFLCFR